jgi:hypothetical protein
MYPFSGVAYAYAYPYSYQLEIGALSVMWPKRICSRSYLANSTNARS